MGVLVHREISERVGFVIKLYLLERGRAQRVESESLLGMDNSQLSSQGQDGTLAGGVGKLSSRSSDDGDHAGGIDDASRNFAMLS